MKLPTKALTNEELSNLAKQLKIPLLGVFMKDEIPKLNGDCCGIINFQTTHQLGSHWSCFYIKDGVKYYFDSFGETPPPALIKRLKTTQEIKNSTPVIRQSSVQVQQDNSTECGSLCLWVLFHSQKLSFDKIIQTLLERYIKAGQGIPAPLHCNV